MTGHTASKIIMYGFVGLLFVIALLGSIGLKGLHTQYLHPSPNGFTIRSPWVMRAFFVSLALFFLLSPLIMFSDDLGSSGGVLPNDRHLFWIWQGWTLAMAAFFLWAGRPEQLALDSNRRTYRYTYGWPSFQRVRTGLWSDLGDIWINGGIHTVYVGWRGEVAKMPAGRFVSLEDAERYADELASLLDLPRLPVPPPQKIAANGTETIRLPFKIAALIVFPGALILGIIRAFVFRHPIVYDWIQYLVVCILLSYVFVVFKKLFDQAKK